jgi:hypothetical protein
VYHQPELCALLLRHVRAVNEDRLGAVRLASTHRAGSKQVAAGAPLLDLVQLGMDNVAHAPALAAAVLHELAAQSTYGAAPALSSV